MKERKWPTLFTKKEDCCGCTACFCICNQQAIQMVVDDEGFEYPVVNHNKCIKCYMCLDVCPIKHLTKEEKEK